MLFYGLLVLIFPVLIYTAKTADPVVTTLLNILKSPYFNSCAVFYVTDQVNSTEHYIVEGILADEKLITSFYNINLNPVKKLEDFNNKTRPYLISKFSQCSVIISNFQNPDIVKKSLATFDTELIPDFGAVTHRDEHNYIFIVPSLQILETLLLSETLRKIKFKIGIIESESNSVIIKSVCFYCQNGNPKLLTLSQGRPISMDNLFPDYTLNGYGHQLLVSSPTRTPFIFEIHQVNGEWRPKRGVYLYSLNFVTNKYNFTYKVFPSSGGGGSGAQFKNLSWNGVVGDLINNRADIGVCTSANPVRFVVIGFTKAVIYCGVSFITGIPKKTFSWRAIYKPFKAELWLATFTSLITVIITLRVFKNRNKLIKDSSNFYSRTIEYITFVLIGQGMPATPSGHGARIIVAIWLLSAVVIPTAYVSKLTELLTFPLYQEQPKTFKELVQSAGTFTWGQDKSGGNLYAHFKSSPNPVFQKVFQGMTPPSDALDCFTKAMQNNFACITWTGTASFIANKNLTFVHGQMPLVVAEDITLFVPTGIATHSRAIFGSNFNKILGMNMEMGQADKWYQMDLENLRRDRLEWERSKGIHSKHEGEQDGPALLSLSNLYGTFYLLAVGLGLSTLLLGTEILNFKGFCKLRKVKVEFSGKDLT